MLKKFLFGFGCMMVCMSGVIAQSSSLSLPEQIAQARAARDAAHKVAPLKDRIAAYFAGKNVKKERVRTLVELTDAEWQLRKKLLQQQKKNRLDLFINRYAQELRMALIALGLVSVGGYAGSQIYQRTSKNQAAREAKKKDKKKASPLPATPAPGASSGGQPDEGTVS